MHFVNEVVRTQAAAYVPVSPPVISHPSRGLWRNVGIELYFTARDGRRRYVKYRLVPLAMEQESGMLSELRQRTPWDQARPPDAADIENMKQVCRYVIMHATFMHTWANAQQYDDAGEIVYSSRTNI